MSQFDDTSMIIGRVGTCTYWADSRADAPRKFGSRPMQVRQEIPSRMRKLAMRTRGHETLFRIIAALPDGL